MQLRLVSSSHYRVPQRLEAVDVVSERVQSAAEDSAGRQSKEAETSRIPAYSESDNAQRQYYYSRVETVVGRTAEALRNYTEVEDGPGREQLQAQLGLDIYV